MAETSRPHLRTAAVALFVPLAAGSLLQAVRDARPAAGRQPASTSAAGQPAQLPEAPSGATNTVSRRRFRVVMLPDIVSKDVVFEGPRVVVGF